MRALSKCPFLVEIYKCLADSGNKEVFDEPIVERLVDGRRRIEPWIISKFDPLVPPGPGREIVGECGQYKLESVRRDPCDGIQSILGPNRSFTKLCFDVLELFLVDKLDLHLVESHVPGLVRHLVHVVGHEYRVVRAPLPRPTDYVVRSARSLLCRSLSAILKSSNR